MTARTWLLATVPLALLAGCSQGSWQATASGGALQFSNDMDIVQAKQIVVLTVDDEATADAASIRALATGALRGTFEKDFEEGQSGLRSDWARADLRVVVVHPSVTGSGRAVGPSDDPALALISDDASTADVDALADAASRSISGAVAPAGAPYAPVDATSLTIQLLSGARAPADAREAALVASLGGGTSFQAIVVTSRDDGGSGGVSAHASWPPRLTYGAMMSLVSPFGGGGAGCAPLDRSTRLSAWAAAAEGAGVRVTTYDTGCAADVGIIEEHGLGDGILADFQTECLPAAVAVRPDGEAACVIDATLPGGAPCSSYLGMLDPRDPDGVRRPRLTGSNADLPGRVCEMNELTGSQAEACRTAPSCAGCAPGWCVTTDPRRCAWGPLRFVHGVVPPGAAEIHILCDIATLAARP
ncbi:MAG: hypothetical protein ACREJ3_01885 [Polyangiaceae bacterium]